MDIRIEQVTVDQLERYGRIPIAFDIRSRLEVEAVDGGLGGLAMREVPVIPPVRRDYDAMEGATEDGGPASWPKRFDASQWGVFIAVADGRDAGGVVVVVDTPTVNLLEGRDDMAVLWDIRVAPEFRGCGVGRRLFEHAAQWAREHGKTRLKIETQNINVPACRFYAAMGCRLVRGTF